MMDTVTAEIEERIAAATAMYGDFASSHEAMGVALEEWDELRQAVRGHYVEQIRWECMDLAAVLIRIARNLRDNPDTLKRSGAAP